MCVLSLSFITSYKYRCTVSKWLLASFFWGGGRKENRNPEWVPVPSLQGMVCSECGVAFVAMCEIWFGEGCHLKRARFCSYDSAPAHTLTQSHCLSPAASVSLHRRPSILLTFSHTFLSRSLLSPRLPVALFIGLLETQMFQRWGGDGSDEWAGSGGQPKILVA